jgi:signal transduction histidine kinase
MTVYYFNLAAASAGIVAALFGLLLALMARYVERWERWYFCATFSLLLAYIGSDLVAQVALVFLGADFTWLARTCIFLELLFSAAIIPLIAAFLLRCAGESWRDSLVFRFEAILFALYVAVLVAAQFGDAVYCISADGHRIVAGPLFPALSISPVLLMVINLVALVRRRASLTQRQRIAFAIYIGIPLVSVLLQAALFDLRIVVVGTSVATLAMFALVLAGQMDAYVRQREEAYRRQSQVMALQMRPHFIYNVMTSIYYLCAQDPERAQRVTLDFTDYLRANFAAVAADGDIPFAKELEHTRAYLAVESARFEDSLIVDIDCPYTAFHLPPLTLQPLVENAVKHGADPERPPLHVRITTRKDPEFSVVTVEDTGPGFDDSILTSEARKDGSDGLLPSDGIADRTANPASALANIRERLVARGSTLDFTSREGGGTVATIRVPLRERDGR